MSFELPDLNTVAAGQLLDELAARIPRVAPKWTEQNASDPGLTLLEMLVWIVEATAYQANCIPFEAYLTKVKFILGLAFSEEDDRPYTQPAIDGLDPQYRELWSRLQAAEREGAAYFPTLREAVFNFRSAPYLASTQLDIEALALDVNSYIDAGHVKTEERVLVARAEYVDETVHYWLLVGDPKKDFAAYKPTPGTVTQDPSDLPDPPSVTVSMSLVEDASQMEGPTTLVRRVVDAVRRYVSPRSLLGNPISIRTARVTFVSVSCTVRCAPRACPEDVAEGLQQAIIDWMQPYSPQPRASALPFGVVPSTAALLSIFADVSGIYAVESLTIKPGNGLSDPGPLHIDVGPVQPRYFKGHPFGEGGVTILEFVTVTANAFSS